MDDLGILYRGAYADRDIKGEKIGEKDMFLTMPNIEGQLVAISYQSTMNFIPSRIIKNRTFDE